MFITTSSRSNTTFLLAGMSVFSIVLSFCRFSVTGSHSYLFLNWNLFLAFIPWAISTCVLVYGHNRRWVTALVVLSWLLFFPNAPYIFTDLFHLRWVLSAPIWFDLILILSFAWTGLFYGFVSLLDIEILLQRLFKKTLVNVLVVAFLFLSAFGIYLGRFLRWNSWDVLSDPFSLLKDVCDRIVHPFAHLQTWVFTILIGVLLNMMYWSVKLLAVKGSVAIS